MEIKLYRYEVEEAAKQLGLTINNEQVQEFIASHHGELEAVFREPIRHWVFMKLNAAYKKSEAV